LEDFAGEIRHAAGYTHGADYVGRRAVVVGTGTSAHDVAQDLCGAGAAAITMVQRGPVTVTNLETSQLFSTMYTEGLAVDDADLLSTASPYPVMIRSSQLGARFMSDKDEQLLAGLARAGLQTDLGEDETGFQVKYFRRGGGYYLNVGCSDLIIDGQIQIRQHSDIERVVPNGIRFKDGSTLETDVIFFATGYASLEETTRVVFGDEVADRLGQIWGFDERGEMANIFKRTEQPNLWFQAGSLVSSRIYSKFLALQIKARLDGLIGARVPSRPGDDVVVRPEAAAHAPADARVSTR
jgi:cation diffusion facilitator CzcD-associated flavoprotein CzcO